MDNVNKVYSGSAKGIGVLQKRPLNSSVVSCAGESRAQGFGLERQREEGVQGKKLACTFLCTHSAKIKRSIGREEGQNELTRPFRYVIKTTWLTITAFRTPCLLKIEKKDKEKSLFIYYEVLFFIQIFQESQIHTPILLSYSVIDLKLMLRTDKSTCTSLSLVIKIQKL